MPAKISRPGKWWREPLSAAQLRAHDDDARDILIAEARIARVIKLKEQLREVRRYSKDFTPDNGYTLRERELIRLPQSKIAKLQHAARQLANAKSRPYVEIAPRTKAQTKSVTQRAGKLFAGQTKFLIHTLQADRTRPRFRDGQLELVVRHKRGRETIERLYLFPRRPRSWDDVREMTAGIQRTGMRHGYYKLVTSLYGPIYNAVSVDRLQNSLSDFFSTYRNEMAEGVLGWQWYGSTYKAQRVRQKKQYTTEERFKLIREHNDYKRKRLIEERLGVAKRCKKCKRFKCKCKAPVFK